MLDFELHPAMQPAPRPTFLTTLRHHALLLGVLVGSMWLSEIVDHVLPFLHLDAHGIRPRTVPGLAGIPLAPFLHGDFPHLISNSLPFLVLGGLVLAGGRGEFLGTTIFVIAVGGAAVWLLAPANSNHIGASGLVFGYLGFLLARGFFEKSIAWCALSLAVLIAYGGLLFGVLPGQPGISWQGHLFGFAAGIVAAWGCFSNQEPPRSASR
jgi:membrane associated rhomboid family serine protease